MREEMAEFERGYRDGVHGYPYWEQNRTRDTPKAIRPANSERTFDGPSPAASGEGTDRGLSGLRPDRGAELCCRPHQVHFTKARSPGKHEWLIEAAVGRQYMTCKMRDTGELIDLTAAASEASRVAALHCCGLNFHNGNCVKRGLCNGLYRHTGLDLLPHRQCRGRVRRFESGHGMKRADHPRSSAPARFRRRDRRQDRLLWIVAGPEDHSKPDGKRISLDFAILKSHSIYPEADPLVYPPGGPGASAMVQIPLLARAFEPGARRATWSSGPAVGRSLGSIGEVFQCLASNAAKIAKKEYTTTAIDGSNENNNTIAIACGKSKPPPHRHLQNTTPPKTPRTSQRSSRRSATRATICTACPTARSSR